MSASPASDRRITRFRHAGDSRLETLKRVLEIVRTDVLEWDTSGAIPQIRQPVAIEVVHVDPRSSDAWRAIVPRSSHRTVAAFSRRSDTGYLAVADGEFAGWIWLSRTSHRDPWSGLRIRLAPGEVYSYALSVPEKFRPRGVAAALIAQLLSDVRADSEVKRVYGWVDRRNRKSAFLLRMVFGYKPIQTLLRVHFLRRWGGQVPFSDRPPYGPLSRRGRHSVSASPPAAKLHHFSP